MLFSVFKVAGACGVWVKKTRHHWRSFEVLLDQFCCCVNLPLLRRLGYGMAKEKMAAKKRDAVHVKLQETMQQL
ncbi:MAG: hypothetical protein H7335_20950 [Massilia sp.]|nr:hypothetical protein [Massilia sp.]